VQPVNYLFEVGKQLALHPDKWRQAIEKPNLVQWFVGKVMKETNGRANMETVTTIFMALAKARAW
jgi:Asp-tRNA(Asn)/Glu-tRNA(Gln) amidotransferase B subunit